MSYLYLDPAPGFVSWTIGACDFIWSNLSGFQYAFYGGRLENGTYCGVYDLYVNIEPTYTNWTIGAR